MDEERRDDERRGPAETDRGVESPAKASGWRRAGAVLLALALGIVAAVGVAVMVDVGDKGVCEDVQVSFTECYDFSSSAKPIVLGFGWVGSAVAALAALLALGFAIRGRGGRTLLRATGLAIVLLAISILVAQAT